MSLSTSKLSYTDCYALLDRALEEPRGIRVEVPFLSAAVHLRMRIHQARQLDRAENAKTYADPTHPLHGRSPYDIFTCRIDAGPPCWLYLDRERVQIGAIESIPEDYQIEPPKPLPTPMLMIEGPKAEAQPTIRRR